ncbi:hypothetical protein RDWZM_003315 [Blomia tropicalis]|uniref:Uncharacterized protein n=1 Tax=Blomia tropicalis TaxID=40697 RepID=A0A9Q0RSK0_BLOTA|nr:hypothetical protein BLOT_000542 [Blomia tropicalis]KAJ6224770.1 hypothetical protein RDWZM_003315 [Blomia tropicalis]
MEKLVNVCCRHGIIFGFILTIFLFKITSSATTGRTCNTANITETELPLIRPGGFDLDRDCDLAIRPRLHECHIQYVDAVRQVYIKSNCYAGSESVKRASCCSMWKAKQCMIMASHELDECNATITELYRQLPISESERLHINDQCSEYGEDVPACEDDMRTSFFGTFVTLLLVLISIPIVVYLTMTVYKRYRNQQELKQKGQNGYSMAGVKPFHDTVDLKEYHDSADSEVAKESGDKTSADNIEKEDETDGDNEVDNTEN